jgi:shikimate dehydrogenase
VIFILNWLRAEKVFVAGRNPEKTRAISQALGGEPLEVYSLADRPLRVDIVINATAVSSPEESPEMAELLTRLDISGCQLVFDLNYGRTRNFWEELAGRLGVPFLDGLPALAHQARRAFALWTGMQVPPREFLQALLEEGEGRGVTL